MNEKIKNGRSAGLSCDGVYLRTND